MIFLSFSKKFFQGFCIGITLESYVLQLGEVAIEQHFETRGSWEQVKFPGLQNFKKLDEFF